jgi:hypothetical protein
MLHVFMIDLAALKNTFNLHKLCSRLHVCFGSWEIEIHCMQIESISVWSSWPKHIMVQKSKYFGLKVLKKYLGGDKLFDSPLISKIYSIVLDFIYLFIRFISVFSFFFSHLEIRRTISLELKLCLLYYWLLTLRARLHDIVPYLVQEKN